MAVNLLRQAASGYDDAARIIVGNEAASARELVGILDLAGKNLQAGRDVFVRHLPEQSELAQLLGRDVRVASYAHGHVTHQVQSGRVELPAQFAELTTTAADDARRAAELLDGATRYDTDLVALAKDGKLSKVIGRDAELDDMVEILGQRSRNSVMLIGEAGTGKTSTARALANRIAEGTVPESLKNARLIELDAARLRAGAQAGEFDARIKTALHDVASSGRTPILLIDDLASFQAAAKASGTDALQQIRPMVQSGEARVVATAAPADMGKLRDDLQLPRLFSEVDLDPLTADQAGSVMKAVRADLETHHSVKVSDEALDAAVKLSQRYIPDQQLPAKAIELIDSAASRAKMGSTKKAPVVSEDDVAEVISRRRGIPVAKLSQSENARYLTIEDELRRSVMGQDEALKALGDALRRSRAGFGTPNKPIGSFIFLGGSGSGKTETAKALAKTLFDDEKALIRFDMSEFMGEGAVQRLTGPPPGYLGFEAGGQLTNAVNKNPYSVIVFDEADKAHPEVQNMLLQLLSDGRLTDGKGKTTDFTNTVFLLTGNWGSDALASGVLDDTARARINGALEANLRPEVRNRFDNIVTFKPLSVETLEKIVTKELTRPTAEAAARYGIELDFTDDAVSYIANKGYDPPMGARTAQRIIDREVIKPLTDLTLSGKVASGSTIRISRAKEGEQLVFNVEPHTIAATT